MPDTSPSNPPTPASSGASPPPAADVIGWIRTVLGVGSLLSLALASSLAVLITAFLGPNLAMLLAMYGGNLEPVLPATPFPWALAVLAALPAGALAFARRFGWAGLALTLEFGVCGWHLTRLLAATG